MVADPGIHKACSQEGLSTPLRPRVAVIKNETQPIKPRAGGGNLGRLGWGPPARRRASSNRRSPARPGWLWLTDSTLTWTFPSHQLFMGVSCPLNR